MLKKFLVVALFACFALNGIAKQKNLLPKKKRYKF